VSDEPDVVVPSYRIAEAAELLGVSDDTVRRWADNGRLQTTTDQRGHTVVSGQVLADFAVTHHHPAAQPGSSTLQSVRNRFVGLVVRVVRDTVMAQVELQCGPYRVVSLISAEAVDELGLRPGVRATASMKATNVSIETAG
jgi:molybdopterin-binding protein